MKKQGRVDGTCVCVVLVEVKLTVVCEYCHLTVDLKIPHLTKRLHILVSLSRRCSEQGSVNTCERKMSCLTRELPRREVPCT